MNKTRILAVPAVAAASLLALTGCFQLPPAGNGGDQTTAPVETTGTGTDGGNGGETSSDLAGTSWSGSLDGFADVEFELQDDGTVNFSVWNDESVDYDYPSDTWSGDASNLTLTITDLDRGEFDVTLTGPAENGSMDLSGQGTDGNSYTFTATQQ